MSCDRIGLHVADRAALCQAGARSLCLEAVALARVLTLAAVLGRLAVAVALAIVNVVAVYFVIGGNRLA